MAARAVRRTGMQRARALVLLLVGLRGFQAYLKEGMPLAHADLCDEWFSYTGSL